MHLNFSILLAVASLSLIQAQHNTSTILPYCAQHCKLQALKESGCLTTNITCACKDPTYAAVFDKCETKNCTTAEQNVTNAYALNLCAQVGRYTHINFTTSSTAARVSGTATPTGNGTKIHNSTAGHKYTFTGTPAPFTGGSVLVKRCGAVVLAGLLIGSMAVAL